MYYHLNGIPSDNPRENEFWITYFQDRFIVKESDLSYELEDSLLRLYSVVQTKLFGSPQKYYEKIYTMGQWIPYAGIDAELKISKTNFEKFLKVSKSNETHKMLYYYDCVNLIGSLQNLVQESKYLFCDFYRVLNTNSFMLQSQPINPTMLMFASGLLVTDLFSKVNHLFITLSSQLDYVTKLLFELKFIHTDFEEYPKLKSKGLLYGDFRKLKFEDISNTVFEKVECINLILNIRNEIIHNSSFENIPKVYQLFEDNVMLEKFVLIPDHTNGNFDTYKNRNRFFDNDVKLNEVLPEIIWDFQKRLIRTLNLLEEDTDANSR